MVTYLSLFAGIGGFECAIHQLFPMARCLGFSEIEPNCLAVLGRHFPDHPALGDISRANFARFRGRVDLVVAGSPCKDLSIAKANRQGLQGQQSSLFWHFVRCLRECQPRYFCLENVASMRRADRDVISRVLGVQPVLIDSQAATAQRRRRLFWCSFPVAAFDDAVWQRVLHQYPSPAAPYARYLRLIDVLESPRSVCGLGHSQRMINYLMDDTVTIKGHPPGTPRLKAFPYYFDSADHTSRCVGTYIGRGSYNVLIDRRFQPPLIRKCTEREIERLQGFADDYTAGISASQRLKALGNAVTVPVALYILHFVVATR